MSVFLGSVQSRGLFAIGILRGDSKIYIFFWKYTVSVVYNLLNYKNIFTALKKQPAFATSCIITIIDLFLSLLELAQSYRSILEAVNAPNNLHFAFFYIILQYRLRRLETIHHQIYVF